jgi:small-conductance mechanosensitive channel
MYGMNTVEVLTLRVLGLRTTLLCLHISLFFVSDIVLLTIVVITILVTVFVVMSVAPGDILFQACISLSFLVIIMVISGFHRGVNETFALLGSYTTLIGS